jgi:hypothetical protein
VGGLPRGMAAVAAACALLPGVARAEERSRATVSGALTVTWRADPQRGCEAAGLCGSTGSLTWSPGSRADLSVQKPIPPYLLLQSDEPAIVRVRNVGGGTCVDAVPTTYFDLESTPLGGGRYALAFPTALSSGRCAGPSARDLASALPSATLDLAALRRGETGFAWAGGPLAVGPWTGEITSTLAVRATRLRARPRIAVRRPARVPARLRGRTIYRTTEDYAYRVTAVEGALGIAFHGSPAGGCAPLDACGAEGTLTLAPGTKGTLEISGERESFTPHPRVRVDGYGELRSAGGRSAETLRRPGVPDCTDSQRPDDIPLGGEQHGDSVRVTLGSPSTLMADALRTRCPGPAQADVFGRGVLASGRLARSALGQARLRVTLRATGSFARSGYAGTRGGAVTLTLERVRARVHTSRRTL